MSRLPLYVWASPNTLLGLLLAGGALLTGGRVRLYRGAVEAHGGVVRWLLARAVPLRGGAAAMVVGHVILGRDEESLDLSRDHEHVHVRQYERWGPLFLPLYFGASLWAWLRGRDAYRDNPFEREAYGAEG